jgi:CheY-like chemotaxis protein
VSISDTGVGMSADFLKKVFEEFERADIVVDKTDPGSGLGLAITKKLITLHRGRIQLKSEEGKGTTVKIILPYHISSNIINSDEQEPNSVKKIDKLKILVVDDVEYNRKLIGAILSRNNVYFKEAENGQEAINILNKEGFDIILMDIRMPLIDGITATKVILKTNDKVQIIALTASTSEKEKEEYLHAGIKRILLKPISERDLLTSIYELSGGTHQTPKEKINNEEKFSLDELWKLCQYDRAFFNEMLDTFIKTSTGTLDAMKIALKEKDLKQISFLAHRLSGPIKNIGAESFLGYLKLMEHNSGKNTELIKINNLLAKTEKGLDEILQFISESRHKY